VGIGVAVGAGDAVAAGVTVGRVDGGTPTTLVVSPHETTRIETAIKPSSSRTVTAYPS
jgi:hypothetical protein